MLSDSETAESLSTSIKNMTPLPDFVLNVQFAEGVTKQYDMKPLFERYPMFAPLRDQPELYYSAAIDLGGYGVVWNGDIDIACDELYHNGEVVHTPFDGLIALSDATQLWGLSESTLRSASPLFALILGGVKSILQSTKQKQSGALITDHRPDFTVVADAPHYRGLLAAFLIASGTSTSLKK